ncbi:VanZ family protein [Streptomyces diastatochromogenes]|nr:VanZ family protein [Streptomyces diastatochromogenes]
MIDAFIGANPLLGPSLVLIVLATAIAARPLYRRHGRAALAWLGTAASGAVVLVATLAPLGPHAPASRMCSVPEDFAAALVADQALLNIALFVPLGFFLTASTRRPVTVVPALAVLSGAIEVTQALVPGMARACDVSDLGANALGALAGCLVAVAWRRRRAAVSPAPGRAGRHDVRNGWSSPSSADCSCPPWPCPPSASPSPTRTPRSARTPSSWSPRPTPPGPSSGRAWPRPTCATYPPRRTVPAGWTSPPPRAPSRWPGRPESRWRDSSRRSSPRRPRRRS